MVIIITYKHFKKNKMVRKQCVHEQIPQGFGCVILYNFINNVFMKKN